MAVDEEALLEEIGRDPDDERAYLVYADWLQARGDPRGELISIQQALRAGGQDPDRVRRQRILQDSFLRENDAHFLDGLWERTEGAVTPAGWRFGFIERVLVMGHREGPSLETCLEALFALKSARFVRDLSLERDGVDAFFPWLERTGAWRYPRALELGSKEPLANLAALTHATPGLTRLSVQSVGASWAGLELPGLTSLRIRGDLANVKTLGGFDTVQLPALQTLTLSFRRWEPETIALLTPALTVERTPALRHVDIPDDAARADEVILAIVHSGLIDRLETLALTGPLSKRLTRELHPHKSRLAALRRRPPK